MKSLFISTYNELITIALLAEGMLLAYKENISERSHSTYLIPLIESILKDNALEINDLGEIIVINGPGSFTGIRLGVTVAKTLAYTLKIPIKTVTSIEAIGVSDNSKDEKLVTLADAKGYYYGLLTNNKLIGEIKYLKNDAFNLLIKKAEYKSLLIIAGGKLNIEAIYKYVIDKKSINPHEVKPIYIKIIEVENDL